METQKAIHDYESISGIGCEYYFTQEEILNLERKTNMILYTEEDLFNAIHKLIRMEA